MMKILSILLMTLIFGAGGRLQFVQSTSQEWMGGLRESGYGTDYRLTVIAKAGSDKLKVEDLWVGDYHMKVKVIVDQANPRETNFKKGSRLLIKSGMLFRPGPDEKMELLNADNLKRPYNFKGEGLLGYSYKGHKAYLEIAEFKKLEKIIYP